MKTLNPYLTYNGNCEEAFNFYKSILGGELSHLSRFKEMPPMDNCTIPESEMEKIMHVSLPISDECVLMGSDSSEAFGQATVVGNNFALSISVDTEEEVDRIFNALAEGGKITMPASKTFWGSYFGMLIDKFDIQWMVSCATAEHK